MHFSSKRIHTTKYCMDTFGPKLWNLVPNEYKAIKTLVEGKNKLYKTENLPNRFYLTSQHDNSRILIKLSKYKKIIFTLFYRYIFPFFWLTLTICFCRKLCKTFLSTVTK